jgi:hypothetical protein
LEYLVGTLLIRHRSFTGLGVEVRYDDDRRRDDPTGGIFDVSRNFAGGIMTNDESKAAAAAAEREQLCI